jgi:hypothetical protein
MTSVELVVLAAGSEQNGKVGIGIFPEGEEVLVGLAALWKIAGEGGSACDSERGEGIDGTQRVPAAVVESTSPVDSICTILFSILLEWRPGIRGPN